MSTQQESGSDFASVVRVVDRLPPWPKLAIDEPLAQLHAKFWGKSMVDEERQWRNSQPELNNPTVGELGGGDQRMDEDEDFGDVNDDIIAGCYVLNIDIQGLEFEKIWIRADYIRIYDFLETRNGSPVAKGKAPSAVITGQPGIGKSVWVYYALRRRLAERKPVIWYLGHRCYLFVSEGVYEASPPSFRSSYFHTFVWTLVDSDEAKEGVPTHLVPHGTRLFVVYSTSPRRERWSRLHKTVRNVTIIMNPWTRKEMSYAMLTRLPAIIDYDRINHIYDMFGPTPRVCIDFVLEPVALEEYEIDVRKAISNITLDALDQLFKDASSLTLDAISHKIGVISRENNENVASQAIVEPITPSIQSRLAGPIRKLELREQIRLYHYFSKVPDSRGIAGIVFEAAAQLRLQDGVELQLIPMVYVPTNKKNSRPQWYSSHVLLRNKALEESRLQALQQASVIHVKPSHTLEYTDNGPSSIEPGIIYVPELSNQVALDSFILLCGLLYIFQFTIGGKHDIKPGLVDFFATCRDIPPMDKWRFVFIIPPNLTLIRPEPWRLEMRKLRLYSAVISL